MFALVIVWWSEQLRGCYIYNKVGLGFKKSGLFAMLNGFSLIEIIHMIKGNNLVQTSVHPLWLATKETDIAGVHFVDDPFY